MGSVRVVNGIEVVRTRKTRGMVPDGLVQARINNFVMKFPGLGGDGQNESASSGSNRVSGSEKRKLDNPSEIDCRKGKYTRLSEPN